jgi:hypothetical protein
MILILVLLSFFPQDSFTRFTYCKESARGPYESQCVSLNPQGAGEARLKPRGDEELKIAFDLSAPGRDRFVALLAATNFLAAGAEYESNKRVADLGLKKLLLEMPSGRREAVFNFSTLKEVTELGTFFDALINQETLLVDIDTALQFERLSIPKRLDQIENELKANRIADPQRLIPLLERIEKDQRLVNFARTRAGRLKQQLLASKRS